MTDKAKELVNIAWRGSVDLVLGTFTAYWVQNVMNMLKSEPKTFSELLFRIFGQLALTLWTGSEARGLLVDTNAQDPTGGIVFIASVFRQKSLWKNVDHAAKEIETWLHSLIGHYTARTLPEAATPAKKYHPDTQQNPLPTSQPNIARYQ